MSQYEYFPQNHRYWYTGWRSDHLIQTQHTRLNACSTTGLVNLQYLIQFTQIQGNHTRVAITDIGINATASASSAQPQPQKSIFLTETIPLL
jgi:hypothetical protein